MKRKDALWVMQMCRDRDARSEAEIEAFDTAIEALKNETIFSADRSKVEWIPCAEKMPSEKKAVLICDSHGNRFVGKLVLTDHGYKWGVPLFRTWVDIEDGDVWMPLPKPYGERSEK